VESIIVAVLALVGTLAGTYFANRKSSALIAYRLEELEKRVQAHNNLVERTYKLEEQAAQLEQKVSANSDLLQRTYELEKQTELQEEKIKVANHRIEDLENEKN